MDKHAAAEHPVHELIARRWSPVCFDGKAVTDEDLRSLLEAVRWAASSYNEQPWHFLVATKREPEGFEKLLSCLLEGNQQWASAAPVLVMTVAGMRFARNGKDNCAAFHDIGLAVGNLLLEATARGLAVHQMIGILPERAREVFEIPEDYEPLTALAIGYRGEGEAHSEGLRHRDQSPRQRKALREFVFSGTWGKVSGIVA